MDLFLSSKYSGCFVAEVPISCFHTETSITFDLNVTILYRLINFTVLTNTLSDLMFSLGDGA